MRASADQAGMSNNLRLPSYETLCLQPESLPEPLAIEHKHCMAGATSRFMLGAILLAEKIHGKDVPRPAQDETAYAYELRTGLDPDMWDERRFHRVVVQHSRRRSNRRLLAAPH